MRTTKVWNISIPPDMATAAEKAAKEEARTKSELIREALRQYLWGRRWKAIREYGERKVRDLGFKEEDVDDLVHQSRKARR